MEKIKPRKSDLVVQDLEGEVLIYDLNENKALCLNQTASLIWRLCDGEKSVSEISQEISKKLNSSITEDFVWLALEQFKRENLLEKSQTVDSKFADVSRRELVKKVGLATMVALPLVSSVVAPTALHAQSSGCTENAMDFCISPQMDVNSCVDAIFPLEMTSCCAGTFTVVTFDNPLGSNSCCGTCGPRIA